MNFRRPHPDPKRDSYKVKDTCYKAGRAAVMELKRRVPLDTRVAWGDDAVDTHPQH